MGQPLAWFEIISDDAGRATRFYTELFGWTATSDPDLGGYTVLDTGNGDDAVGGGIGAPSGPGETGVRIYFRVPREELDDYLGNAEKLGGQRVLEPMALPQGFGTIAVFTDPDGNPVGLWA
jgi:predicted enzyme related to lactoylglutathione lyase